jgi:hypothetical protein
MSGADRIVVNSEYLSFVSGKIANVANALEECCSSLQKVRSTLQRGDGANARAKCRVKLQLSNSNANGSTVSAAAAALCRALRAEGFAAKQLANNVKKVSAQFQETERSLMGETGNLEVSDSTLGYISIGDVLDSLVGRSSVVGLGRPNGKMVRANLAQAVASFINGQGTTTVSTDPQNVFAEKAYAYKANTMQFGIAGSLGSISATIGAVEATGSVKATLIKDGHLAPSIELHAKGEASLVKVQGEGEYGNLKVNGEATVGAVEGEVNAGLGVITVNGEETFGVKGDVNVGVYAAKGNVKASYNFFGIEIGISASGSIGAGFSAEGYATTGGVYGKLGGCLGIGGDVGISVDWSKSKVGKMINSVSSLFG